MISKMTRNLMPLTIGDEINNHYTDVRGYQLSLCDEGMTTEQTSSAWIDMGHVQP